MEEKLPGCVAIFFALFGLCFLSLAIIDASSPVTECGNAVVTDKYYSEYYVREDGHYNGKSFRFYVTVERDGVTESVETPLQIWELVERGQTIPVKQKTNFLYSRKYVEVQ